jgi:hypothetical protein
MAEHVTTPTTAASATAERQTRAFWQATAATGVVVVAVGVVGTLAHRGFGRVPCAIPAWP